MLFPIGNQLVFIFKNTCIPLAQDVYLYVIALDPTESYNRRLQYAVNFDYPFN